MEINLDVKSEDISRLVAEAVLKSTIGIKINEVVADAVKNMGGWDSPMKKAIERVVHDEIVKIVVQEHGDKIREAIRAQMTDQIVADVSKAAWDSFFNNIEKRR